MKTEQLDQSITCTLEDIFVGQEANIDHAVRCLKVIAHPVRLKILCVLQNGEYTVQTLEKYVDVAQATLSQHLTLLKDRGILKSRREGNYSIYALANEGVADLFELIRKIFCD